MEGSVSSDRQARGRNNLNESNWEGNDYTNDDKVNMYC